MSHPLGIIERMTARDVDVKIAGIARRQHSVFNRQQAHRVGASNRMIAIRVASGAWLQLDTNVFCLPGGAPTWPRQVEAARLEAAIDALACLGTADALHGMDGCRRARPQILVAGWAPKNLTLGDIHRTSDLSAV